MKMKMKTFEVSVVITIEAEDATTAAEEVAGCLDYMFEVSNDDETLIAYNVLDDVEEVED
jgi:hypothetical protein